MALKSTGRVGRSLQTFVHAAEEYVGSRPEAGCPSAPWKTECDGDIKTRLSRQLLYPYTPNHPVFILFAVTMTGTATVSKMIFSLRVLKVLDSL